MRSALSLAVVVLTACSGPSGDRATTTTHNAQMPVSLPPATTAPLLQLTDADLAEILAIVVPAAIVADPDRSGEVLASMTYVVADALGRTNEVGGPVSFIGAPRPLTESTRAAVVAAISPATVEFATPDLTRWMLLIAEPVIERELFVVVTFEQRCGGEPGALCGSGGAFRLKRGREGWLMAHQITGWIS